VWLQQIAYIEVLVSGDKRIACIEILESGVTAENLYYYFCQCGKSGWRILKIW
jgi:hypothetical protein